MGASGNLRTIKISLYSSGMMNAAQHANPPPIKTGNGWKRCVGLDALVDKGPLYLFLPFVAFSPFALIHHFHSLPYPWNKWLHIHWICNVLYYEGLFREMAPSPLHHEITSHLSYLRKAPLFLCARMPRWFIGSTWGIKFLGSDEKLLHDYIRSHCRVEP